MVDLSGHVNFLLVGYWFFGLLFRVFVLKVCFYQENSLVFLGQVFSGRLSLRMCCLFVSY